MTLRTRLTLGLLTIAVILIVPLLIAARSLDRLHTEVKMLRDGDFGASLVLGRLRDAINHLRSSELALQFVHTDESRLTMERGIQSVEQLADSLDAYGLGGAARDIRTVMEQVRGGSARVFASASSGRGAEAEGLSAAEVEPAIASADTSVARAEAALRDRTRGRVIDATIHAQRGRSATVLGLALAVFVAAIIAALLTRAVSRPVYELERGMRRVADGDFTGTLAISASRHDEFGRLAASFQDMTRQLAELDRIKAEFVSVASHELKTPINVILGYTQLLGEGVYGPLTDKQRSIATTLEKQTQTLSRLVKQLLDISRFEAGSGRLDTRPTELRGFLHNLEEAFQVLADQRGIRFDIVVHDGVPSTVYWDADRMNEVLGNLLSNAFKFTERGGAVELTVMPVENAIQMEVRDTGAGIPPEQVPRVFEKFYQADNQRAAAGSGSGLGLAIARQIVEAHHGSIVVESTPGIGTTFTIVLPERVEGARTSASHRAIAEVA